MNYLHPIESEDSLFHNYRMILEFLPTPVLVICENYRVLVANGAFKKMIGDNAEIQDKKIDSIQGFEFIKNMIESDEVSPKADLDFNTVLSGKRSFSLSLNRFIVGQKAGVCSIITFEDVTERKINERKLRLTAEKFRSVLVLAKDAIVIVKSDGLIEFANKKVESYFGYQASELIGMPYEMLVPKKDREENEIRFKECLYNESFEAGKWNEKTFYGLRKDGSEFPADISLSQVKVNGDFYNTMIIRDITEYKKLEDLKNIAIAAEMEARKNAERSNQTKDLFLATLSHELRTPLTSILSWSQLIQRLKMNPEKVKHAASAIEQNALIQGQLIEDLLDLARIQSGKFALHLTEVDPEKVVLAAIESVHFLIQKKSIQIISKIDEKIPQVFIDSSRLQQILWNLLTNAIKFSPNESTINVIAEFVEPNVVIKVIDHGKGISKQFLPKVFKRFSQEDSTSVRAHGGLGLGLSLVYDLVKMQHGSIKAESEGEGLGAVFTVTFPAIKNHVLSKTEIHSDEKIMDTDLSDIKILLVDDEPDLLDSISTSLRFYGAEVETASSCSMAIEKMNEKLPDVLISDIAMPKEDGYALISKIRSKTPKEGGKIPAIAFTAYASKEDEIRTKEAGFQMHISKPVKSIFLAASVAKLIKDSGSKH